MAEKIKVGLIYSYDKDWIAGSYYILNLVNALCRLKDEEKPELVILSYSQEEYESIQATGYPYLTFHRLYKNDLWASYRLSERILNRLSRILTGKMPVYRSETYKRFAGKLDLLFPAISNVYFSEIKNRLFWIPDFQEHFLPHFFSEQEIGNRKAHQEMLAERGLPVVFSSNNALQHFKKLYPHAKSKVFVLPFAVTHPAYTDIPAGQLFLRYNIDRPYFFCPNQFWAHKNHITVLKAINILRQQGQKEILVVFSGKEYDNRNPGFFEELKHYVKENKLEAQVRFLGFIEREDQLQLMNKAICVVQPSLFEGWSTVIEDAKSMSQYVVASDLPVHREQLPGGNVTFFNPADEAALAELLKRFMQAAPLRETVLYEQNIKKFGREFLSVVHELQLHPVKTSA